MSKQRERVWPHLLIFIGIITTYILVVYWLDNTDQFPDSFNAWVDRVIFSIPVSK